MSQTAVVSLSPKTISELEPIAIETHESIQAIVDVAVTEYLRQWKKRKLREQLSKQYQELAMMWNEFSEDLASEKWLPVENEALLKFEKSLDK